MSEEKETRERTLEPRREERKTQLRQSLRRAWRSTALRRCLEWGLRLALGAVLAAGRVLEGCSPFGVALVAACGPGAGGFAALLGAAGGYLLSLGLDEALRYTACCILVFAVSFAFYDLPIYQKSWFTPLSAALLNALTGFVTLQDQVRRAPARFLPVLVGEFALTALASYAFRVALTLRRGRRERPEDGPGADLQREEATFRQQVCLVLLCMAALVSLSRLRLVGVVSVGRLAAVWMTLWAGYAAGAGGGAAVGLCMGLAMDLAGGGGRVYALIYGFSGLFAGVFHRNGRFTAALSCALAGAVAALWNWEQGGAVAIVAEALIGGGLFLAAPQRLLDRLSFLLLRTPSSGPDADRAAQSVQDRLHAASAAFQQAVASLKSAFSQKSGGVDEDPSVIYDQAANKVCSRCPLRERCWQSQYQDTHDLLNAALPALLEDHAASPGHFPQRFRDRCVNFPALLTAIDQELRDFLVRRQYDRQVGRSRRAVCRQYEQMAQVLEDAAAAMAVADAPDPARTRRLNRFLAGRELRCRGTALADPQGRLRLRITGPDAASAASATAVRALSSALEVPLALVSAPTPDQPVTLLRQQEPLSAVAGVSGRRKPGSSVSGDACAWFKDDAGQLYLLLCDGMGTGREARKESELAIDLLEKLLRAGFSPENALTTLDQTFCLRLDQAMGFSTVDLVTLDLFSGAGTLYKLGAAASYLKQGGTIRALRGKALPPGLGPDAAPAVPDRFSLRLGPGDCLVLLTDGIFDPPAEEGGAEAGEDGGDDRWLRELLLGFEGGSPAALAEVIAAHGGDGDDKTALVLRLGLREAEEVTEQPGKAAV